MITSQEELFFGKFMPLTIYVTLLTDSGPFVGVAGATKRPDGGCGRAEHGGGDNPARPLLSSHTVGLAPCHSAPPGTLTVIKWVHGRLIGQSI